MSSGGGPQDRCEFVLEPGDVSEESAKIFVAGSDSWYEYSEAVCCWRPVGESVDADRCLWHAEIDDKPAEELINLRLGRPERLDGAYVTDVNLDNSFDFDDCRLWAATFEGADFVGASFARADLRDSQFFDTNLQDAEFHGTDLRDTQFTDTDLRDAEFLDSHLPRAQFSAAILKGAEFSDAHLSRTEFYSADLGTALFSNVYLDGAEFTNTGLERAEFHNTDLRGTNFNDADLRRARFPDSYLSSTQFRGANLERAQFPHAVLHHAYFEEADLVNTEFLSAFLSGAQFSDADLREAQFSDADLREAQFSDADLSHTEFPDADLRDAELPDADLFKAQFPDADLPRADLTNADLRNTEFPNATLRSADLTDAVATGAIFTGAALDNALLVGTDLTDAVLTDTRLREARLFNVRLSAGTNFGLVAPEEADADWFAAADFSLPDRLRWWLAWWCADSDMLATHHDQLDSAHAVYRTIQRLYRENSMPDFLPYYAIRAQETQRKQAIINGNLRRWFQYASARWVMGYGERPSQVLYIALAIVLVSALLYPVPGIQATGGERLTYPPLVAEWPGSLIETGRVLAESLYFSVITFTTLGYGDVAPAGWGKLVATTEAASGVLLTVLLAYVLGRADRE